VLQAVFRNYRFRNPHVGAHLAQAGDADFGLDKRREAQGPKE
jgi:hypothetical protein